MNDLCSPLKFSRDVTIACKDVEIDEIEKLLAEIKDRQAQLEKDKKDNLAEIAKLEGELASLKASNESKYGVIFFLLDP